MSQGSKLDEYLQQGIYGKKDINPAERKKFLGTLRERIVVVLTTNQVYESKVNEQVEKEMEVNKKAKLLLNGSIAYEFLRKYIKMANKYSIPFTIVENKDSDTDIGLVLTYDYAIDKENIYIQENKEAKVQTTEDAETSLGVKGIFKKLFSKS